MSVKIRLARHGAKKRPFYRIVVADTESPRDGKYLETVGTYNPLLDPAEVLLKAWVETRFGRRVDNQKRLPAEWTDFFVAPPRALMSKRSQWIYGAVGVATMVAVLIAGFYGFRWLRNLVSGGDFGLTGFGKQALSYGLTLFGIGIVGTLSTRVFRVLRRPWISLGYLEVDIVPDLEGEKDQRYGASVEWDSGETRNVLVRANRWRPRWAFKWPPYRLVPSVLPEEGLPVVGTDPYHDLAKALPQTLTGALKSLTDDVRGGGPFRVSLKPSRGLHGPCWEALFTLGRFDAENRAAESRPFWVERLAEASRFSASLSEGPHRGISLAPGEVSAAVVQRAWETGAARGRIDWGLSRTVEEHMPGVQVLHVIGSVMEDPSGLRLHLTREPSYASQIEVQKSEFIGEEETFARPLSASDLRRMYPDIRLLILQGYPDKETGFRLGSDRHSAFLMRTFAANVAREGMDVIVIPGLDPALATRVWQNLLKEIPSCLRRGLRALRPTLTRTQDMILAASSDREAGLEKALDVCVYCQGGWETTPERDMETA